MESSYRCFGGGFDRRSYYRSTDSGTCRFDTVYQRETFTGRRRWSGNGDDNPMAASHEDNDLYNAVDLCCIRFTLPAGLGLYWVASAAVRSVQRLAVNKYLSKKSIDDIIKENQEKAKKKREKKGTSAEEINKMATTSTRNVGTSSSKAKGRAIDAEKEEKIRKAQELAKNAKPGSLTSKANLVNKYNSGVKTEEVIPEKQDNKKKK